MKTIIYFSILYIGFVSCSPSDKYPYYNFSNSDYEFIPEEYQETGKIFRFKNQQDEVVEIAPLFYNLKKEFAGASFGQPNFTDYFYYDNLHIEIGLLDVAIPNKPEEYCSRIFMHFQKRRDGNLLIEARVPGYVDSSCSGKKLSETGPFKDFMQMEINGKVYNKIKIINTDEHFTFYNDSNINKVYFDFDHGIVGFDDTQNNIEFRLINE
jgi:hypothetical protein